LQIHLPPILIQNEIVERIESERALVESAKQLIDIYAAKIKSVIAKVWADMEVLQTFIPEVLERIIMNRITEIQDMQWRTTRKIDIRLLASQFGINLKYMNMGNSEYAFTILKEGVIKMQVNQSNSEGRQKFSIAHELAHCVFDKQSVMTGVHRSLDTAHERKMNELGAGIIMPERFVQEIIQNIQPTEANLEKIAKYFGVSKDGIRRRLIELQLFEN
jgi:Zn-dependent peptidase ImmA (M78 family)